MDSFLLVLSAVAIVNHDIANGVLVIYIGFRLALNFLPLTLPVNVVERAMTNPPRSNGLCIVLIVILIQQICADSLGNHEIEICIVGGGITGHLGMLTKKDWGWTDPFYDQSIRTARSITFPLMADLLSM